MSFELSRAVRTMTGIRRCAYAPQHLRAVATGQAQVEDEQVELARAGESSVSAPVPTSWWRSRRAKALLEEGGDALLVLGDQDAVHMALIERDLDGERGPRRARSRSGPAAVRPAMAATIASPRPVPSRAGDPPSAGSGRRSVRSREAGAGTPGPVLHPDVEAGPFAGNSGPIPGDSRRLWPVTDGRGLRSACSRRPTSATTATTHAGRFVDHPAPHTSTLGTRAGGPSTRSPTSTEPRGGGTPAARTCARSSRSSTRRSIRSSSSRTRSRVRSRSRSGRHRAARGGRARS